MIKSTDDANKYYQLVNQYIDEYLENWKVRPSNLKSYILGNKTNLLKFLERRGLKEVSNIETVIKDVIEDRISLSKDSVLTFESFKLFESNIVINDLSSSIFRGIQKATVSHEKILADFFDVSLSQTEVINSDRHLFLVDGTSCYVFSSEEKEILSMNILEHIYKKLSQESIQIKLNNAVVEVPSTTFVNSFEFFSQKFGIENKLNSFLCDCFSGETKSDPQGNLIIIM